jgi:hypothetical protein
VEILSTVKPLSFIFVFAPRPGTRMRNEEWRQLRELEGVAGNLLIPLVPLVSTSP